MVFDAPSTLSRPFPIAATKGTSPRLIWIRSGSEPFRNRSVSPTVTSRRVHPRPDFQQAAAEALPFPDETFDGVISSHGVIFSDAPSQAVGEVARVLRPVAVWHL